MNHDHDDHCDDNTAPRRAQLIYEDPEVAVSSWIMMTMVMTILHHIEHTYDEDPEAAFHIFADDDDQVHRDDNID